MNSFTQQLYMEAYADKSPEEIAALKAIEIVIKQRAKVLETQNNKLGQNKKPQKKTSLFLDAAYLAYQDARGAWALIALIYKGDNWAPDGSEEG